MSVPDDSALFHRGAYDPAKAREYYLRTRQLKGRKPGSQVLAKGKPQASVAPSKGKKAASKREQLEAQKAALEKRLDRLRDVLRELVDAAKKRSGVDTDKEAPDNDPKETASRNESKKKDTPLTSKQKKEKADKAREEYQKNNGGPTLSKEVEQLQRQVQDIRAKIQKAVEDARTKSSTSKPQTASKGR